MKPIDWTPLYKKYPGKWVALKSDEITVLAVGDSPLEAREKALKSGYKEYPILTLLPKILGAYVGSGQDAVPL